MFTLNLALAVISDAYENQEEDWEVASRDAQNHLKHVQLEDEAILISNLGYECIELKTEREGYEGALDFTADDKETEEMQEEVDRCTEAIKEVAQKIYAIADELAEFPECSLEALCMCPTRLLWTATCGVSDLHGTHHIHDARMLTMCPVCACRRSLPRLHEISRS